MDKRDEHIEWLKREISETDAGEFEDIVRHMSRLASQCYADRGDPAWARAGMRLNEAAAAIASRSSN